MLAELNDQKAENLVEIKKVMAKLMKATWKLRHLGGRFEKHAREEYNQVKAELDMGKKSAYIIADLIF